MKKLLFPILIVFVGFLCGCSGDDNIIEKKSAKDYFTQWNSCEALTALQEYVEDVTNPNSKNFIKEEDRIATFDMDGTFVGELYPTYFEYNLLEYRVLDDETYKDIAPDDVKEAAQNIRDFVRNGKKLPSHFDMIHAQAAAKAYAGMTLAQFDTYVKAYAAKQANGFRGMTYGQSFYKPMLQVFNYLKANGFTYYVVSGSDRFICRALVEAIGISPNRVIGMDVKLRSSSQGDETGVNYTMGKEEDLIRTDELIIKNLKTNKVLQITQEIGKVPVLSFGNSSGDCAMHNFCLSNTYRSAAFMLIADDDSRDHADREKALSLGTQWREAGYHVISMRDDFKTIYGDGIVAFTTLNNFHLYGSMMRGSFICISRPKFIKETSGSREIPLLTFCDTNGTASFQTIRNGKSITLEVVAKLLRHCYRYSIINHRNLIGNIYGGVLLNRCCCFTPKAWFTQSAISCLPRILVACICNDSIFFVSRQGNLSWHRACSKMLGCLFTRRVYNIYI